MTGIYVIRAVNEHGKDEAEVEFVVLGPPGPPSELEVADVHKEGCKIKWKPPKDDGGSPVQKYYIEKLNLDTGMINLRFFKFMFFHSELSCTIFLLKVYPKQICIDIWIFSYYSKKIHGTKSLYNILK